MQKRIFSTFSFLILMVLGSSTLLVAQSESFDDVTKIYTRNMGPIIKDKEVKGYYMFYEVDKVDRKTREYLLQIMDANLNLLGSKKIVDSKYVVLYEASYNGSVILMKFYNVRDKIVIYRAYDENAELVYRKTRELEKRWELAAYANVNTSTEITNKSIFPILNKGFVEYAVKKEKKPGYEIKFMPNTKGERGWTKGSNPDSKEVETATFIGANEDIILSQVIKQRSVNATRDMSYFIQGRETSTGKKVFQKELADSRYELSILNAYLGENGSNEIAVLGQFYAKGANTVKDKSLGLFSFIYDKDGKLVNKNYAQWERDVGKFVDVSKKGKLKDLGYVYFHEIVQSADGKIFAIGETFRRTASALGIASAVLGGGGSVTKITIEDMAIFEFSPSFELKNVHFFDKNKSNAELGDGGDLTRIYLLARMLDQFGWFDYAFTQRTPDNSEFLVGYVDYQRNQGARNELVFGALAYADGEFTTDKIKLGLDRNGRGDRVMMAKPGYVMLTSYDRKAKKMTWNLEKINY